MSAQAACADESGWPSRPVLAAALRTSVGLAPVAVSIAVLLALDAVMARPGSSGGWLAWLLEVLAVGWIVSWLVHRVVVRVLPLAMLLELSLCFPDGAPSRLRLAQRANSTRELGELSASTPDESTQQAAERMLVLISALGRHDRRTRGHAERVRSYTELIARAAGMSERDRDRLRWAALLHDIGKLVVPADVLNKDGKPSAQEWEVLRRHPHAGAELAGPLLAWLAPMHLVIEEHHERWDGSGYPSGKTGPELSEGSRIVQVADCFEVMTSARSYQRPVRKQAALRELVRCAGSQFDPEVVRALLTVPQRRLLWAMGPVAWIAGLPLLGHSGAKVLSATSGQLGTAAATAVIAGVALTPTPVVAGPASPVPAVVVVGDSTTGGATDGTSPTTTAGGTSDGSAHEAPASSAPAVPAGSAVPGAPAGSVAGAPVAPLHPATSRQDGPSSRDAQKSKADEPGAAASARPVGNPRPNASPTPAAAPTETPEAGKTPKPETKPTAEPVKPPEPKKTKAHHGSDERD